MLSKYVKGLPFFNERYTYESSTFSAKMAYKRTRRWTSGRSLPRIKQCRVPLGSEPEVRFVKTLSLALNSFLTHDAFFLLIH